RCCSVFATPLIFAITHQSLKAADNFEQASDAIMGRQHALGTLTVCCYKTEWQHTNGRSTVGNNARGSGRNSSFSPRFFSPCKATPLIKRSSRDLLTLP